jgi:tripartite-type tricarboxylate transporter receptor subunit TctC
MLRLIAFANRVSLRPVFIPISVLFLLLAGFAGGYTEAADFDAAKYFKGKTIRLVVDFKPGGGTDIQARYFAQRWGKFIPGNPNLEVNNLFPNPAGRNYVWKSKPDGLTLSFVSSATIGRKLVDPSAIFDTEKFTQIGTHAKRDVVLLVRGTVPYNSIPEARGGKVKITIAEPIGRPEDLTGKLLATGMLALWFDVPLKIVTVARSGSSDALLMLERGDINGWIAGSQWYSLPKLRPGWFKKGFLKPIADIGNPGAPSIPNAEIKMPIPNAVTWLNAEQKALWEGIVIPEVLHGKGIAGPPNMPVGVTTALRESYLNALKDPGFAKGLERIQRQPVAVIPGEKLQKMMINYTAAFKKQLPNYKKVRQQVYDRYFKGIQMPTIPGKIAGKIKDLKRGGRLIMVGGHGVKISGSRTKITVKGKSAKRQALKVGMSCKVKGAMRKGKYEAKSVNCN